MSKNNSLSPIIYLVILLIIYFFIPHEKFKICNDKNIIFDIKTISGNSSHGFDIECVYPCSAGGIELGQVGEGGWGTTLAFIVNSDEVIVPVGTPLLEALELDGDEENTTEILEIYPNPTTEKVQIDMK